MPRKKASEKICESTVMIRVFPEDAEWINQEAVRRTKIERKRNTQYSVVHDLIESHKLSIK